MRAIRIASAALLSAAALGLATAPTALAEENEPNITSFGFSVTPETVAPGGTVTLTSDGCEVPSVTVTSGVFDTVTLNEGRPGSATVDVEAKAGARYEITFDCKGERGTANLTIAPHTGPDHDKGDVTGPDTSPGAHKGVKAGFGSEAGSADEGLGATELVTGVLLIAGALGAAVVLTRRRGADGNA
ncbi:hypothetical protein ASC82_14000 [Streptomyces sp. Root431]|uniref:hypothetical protein n=1 Tax=Streptomyces sp. Root431 TaxID=1736535 RepID=UPI0006F342C4|nr:hypothetical protein [Streptomyces sp. Root431]KQX12331.1 hypothetical protein ASC82_14000 [Streptomyces sp. Root431]